MDLWTNLARGFPFAPTFSTLMPAADGRLFIG